jgi:hypothetical protein
VGGLPRKEYSSEMVRKHLLGKSARIFGPAIKHLSSVSWPVSYSLVPKRKNLRVALPRGDAEDLFESRSLHADNREPRTHCSQLDPCTSPRGQALNPIQVWLPPPKTRMLVNPLHAKIRNI